MNVRRTAGRMGAAIVFAFAAPTGAAAGEGAVSQAEAAKPPVAPREGFVIESASRDDRLQVRGYLQVDGRFFPDDAENRALDTFLLRRVRPIVSGTVAGHFDFQLMPDFGGGTTSLQEAWVELRYSPKARLRAGKFKAPFGLERLQSATATAFAERALPTGVAPNRDLGVQLHGELAEGIVSYAAGVSDGAPDGGSVDVDAGDGKDVVGRVFLSPFRRGTSVLKQLGFGIAGTWGRQTGAPSQYRSPGQVTVISFLPGVSADGTRTRYAPQLSLFAGRLGLLAEYTRSRSRLARAAAPGPALRTDLDVTAWQATATVTLTGEPASYSGVRARNAFDPRQGRWGALELAARVHGLEIGRAAAGQGLVDPARSIRRAFAWAVGVNWSLNRNVRQMLDYERTTFRAGAVGGDRPAENALFFRTQLSY